MLVRKYLIALWLLLMLGIIFTRCLSHYYQVQYMTANAKQAPSFYDKLVALASPHDVQYDQNGYPTDKGTDNKDLNNLYGTTKTLYKTVYTTLPTNLSANVLAVHHTFLNQYAQQLDADFQNYIADTLRKVENLMAPPASSQEAQQS